MVDAIHARVNYADNIIAVKFFVRNYLSVVKFYACTHTLMT